MTDHKQLAEAWLSSAKEHIENTPYAKGDTAGHAIIENAIVGVANTYAILHLADKLDYLFDNYLYDVGGN